MFCLSVGDHDMRDQVQEQTLTLGLVFPENLVGRHEGARELVETAW